MWNSFIWLINRTLSGAITSGQSGPESYGTEGVRSFPQNSIFTEASNSVYLMSHPWHLFVGFYSSAEILSLYSTTGLDIFIDGHWPKRRENTEYMHIFLNV